MQATDKANGETQRSAAYESLHYACLQAIEILKPTIIKEKRREIVNIDLSNIEAFAKYSFKETGAEINVNVNIRHTIESDGIITHDWKAQISASIEIKCPFFSYVFNAYDIDRLYKKLAPVLPEYRNTGAIERFETETETETPENWLYCATITDKKEFKAVAKYANERDELSPAMHHVHINAAHGEIVASDSHILTSRQIEAERSAMIPLEAQKYIADSKCESTIYVNESGDEIRVVNVLNEKIFAVDPALKYPTYKAVIPAKTDKTVIFADKKELLKSIKLVAKNANKASQLIKFRFEASQCTISAREIDFSVSSSMFINCTSTISGEIGFNASRLEKVLKSIDGNKIEFNLTDPSRAVMINDNCLIMPMILDGESSASFEYTQQAAPIAEPQAEALEPTGQYLPVLYVAPAEFVRNLPAIYTAPKETAEAEPLRYLPVFYIKPKKIRKPRAKKNKEPKEKPDIWRTYKPETRESYAPPRDGARKNRLLKYISLFAMVCIMLIINTDKVNGKNNTSKREKIRSKVLRESKKEVHLYHNNSNKAVVLNQSKMITTLNSNERVFLVRSERFMGLSDVFCNVKELQKVIDAAEENGNTAKVFHFWDGKLKVCPKKLYKEMIKANA